MKYMAAEEWRDVMYAAARKTGVASAPSVTSVTGGAWEPSRVGVSKAAVTRGQRVRWAMMRKMASARSYGGGAVGKPTVGANGVWMLYPPSIGTGSSHASGGGSRWS